MPAINVAKTDTFEVQRQKINQIGTALFGITQGGSDLNTEILKIGDGTVSTPSLSFESSPQVGFYKPFSNTFGIASATKRVANFNLNGTFLLQDLVFQRDSVTNDGISILNNGQNYDTGTFAQIPLIGGSGQNAEATIVVSAFEGSIINSGGSGYNAGGYTQIPLVGGTGSGATCSFNVTTDIIEDFVITAKGSGYSVGDILKIPETVNNISTTLDVADNTIVVSPEVAASVTLVSEVFKVSGTGQLGGATFVSGIDLENNILTLSEFPAISGPVVLRIVPLFGDPAGTFQYEISTVGVVESVNITNQGFGYSTNDALSVTPSSLTNDIVYNVTNKVLQTLTFSSNSVPSSAFAVGEQILIAEGGGGGGGDPLTIHFITTSGSFITSMVVDDGSLIDNDTIIKLGGFSQYTVQTASTAFSRFFIDIGSGSQYKPNIIIYPQNKYFFDFSDASNNGHIFSLSKYRDGIWSPSYIQNISTTLSTTSSQVIVDDTTGILPGMVVTVSGGEGALFPNTIVQNVLDSTTVVLNSAAQISGSAILEFRGVEYITNVERTESGLRLLVTDETPTLYYYCASQESGHENEGGFDNDENPIQVNLNNPKVFGSGLSISVAILNTTEVIKGEISSGTLTALSLNSNVAEFDDVVVNNSLQSNSITSNIINTPAISSLSNITITSTNSLFNSNLSVSDKLSIARNTGNLTTSGILKTTSSVNVNDTIVITENKLTTIGQNNLELAPSTGRLTKVVGTGAIIIPAGTTAERPGAGLVEDGAIRFNNQTSQYEGYNSSTSAWSSLGGVRDLDNNTYIVAEASVGANDNTLWFYNDSNNSFRFGIEYQTFYSSKKIRSLNTLAPSYINWSTNLPVTAGQYLKYRNDIYLVVNGGTTGTSGNEPNDTSGNTFLNGSATLQYNTTAVAPLTFEEISEVRIAPLGGTSLVINGDLKLFNNQITTITNDILLTPSVNKKVKVNTTTSLVIPVGSDSEKRSPEIGSIRYNTTINQFEGFNSSLNWTSLGGVRDVDGNTYIIPETAPGANENTLYFYNNNSNTLRVTENQVEFDIIDTIASPTSDLLNINVSLITLDSLATSIDNSDSSRTFISSTKENFDFGISTGLVNDTVLRITDVGDFYYNIGFGTGTYNGIKLLDKDLKTFELKNFKIVTESNTLVKGTSDSGNTIIYNPALSVSAKVQIVAYNLTTGDKEFFEYSVVDEVNDVFYTEYGNIKTGAELISAQFSIVPTGVRLTYTLDSSISAGNNILVKIISQVIKR